MSYLKYLVRKSSSETSVQLLPLILVSPFVFLCVCVCEQLSGAEKPPAGEPENNTSSAAAAGTEAPADGGSKVTHDAAQGFIKDGQTDRQKYLSAAHLEEFHSLSLK